MRALARASSLNRAAVSAGTALAPPRAAPNAREARRAGWFCALLLLLVALILRQPDLGNPDYHVDEEFYALVAERMWHGAIPYVDIWDRKPLGLFLIYAALRPLSGADLVGAQLAGLACAWGTALTLWALARRQAPPLLALLPATLYLFWLNVYGGANAQSPVFYNLPVALAALLCLSAGDAPRHPRLIRRGALAMALVGIAIQIKYTAVFEGAFLGLWLVLIGLRARMSPARLACAALLWATIALAPTILASLAYAAMGEWQTFAFANFTSIFHRARLEAHYLANLKLFILFSGFPLFACALAALIGQIRAARTGEPGAWPDAWFVIGWSLAALCGFMAIGNYYDHYALPLLAPLLVLSARLYRLPVPGAALFVLLASWSTVWWKADPVAANGRSRETIETLAREARPFLRHGPMYIWDGPSILYVAAGATPPSRFAYPDHLSNIVEKDALGADTALEMQRILDQRPAVIVSASRKIVPVLNPVTHRMIRAALARDYVLLDRQPEGWNHRDYLLYLRRDLCRAGCVPRNRLPTSH
jgi:hypothetical protein